MTKNFEITDKVLACANGKRLLCFRCNSALGYLKDDIKILENTIKYLKVWQES